MQLHLIVLQEKTIIRIRLCNSELVRFSSFSSTHEIPEQVHVVFLDPVAEDLCSGVTLGEDQLDEPRCLLLS